MGHLVEHFIDERVAENAVGLRRIDAPTTQLKQRFLIKLADGGSMGALHVIGIDLQLWLGVYLGSFGEQQVPVVHFCQVLLGIRIYMVATVEHGVGRVTWHASLRFMTGAV